ncbi:ABC-three component system protein [Psychromicrobium lacuslunae]|uniref:ABC-three component system protein n=1 Tax=Psychromicrobium lacuslunae TaxID=1618207 RepID=UPI0006980DDC|nr:ABC-three component system protein [Psychromicrobium lacuslunae]
MSNVDSNRFGAAGSALGYLAQIEYALLIALRRMDDEDNLRLSLETVDDITFDGDGIPRELWQTKHHINRQGGIGDASPDLWKTIHNWIETSNEGSACVLFTTATASDGSAAYLLRSGRRNDDVSAARDRFDAVATKAGNTASADYYKKYLSLDEGRRTELLSRIVVIDSAATSEKITDQLQASVRKATIASRRGSLVERLRGWWHGRAMSHLAKIARGEDDWIEMQEIETQLHLIAQSLRDDHLPLDYEDEPEPTSEQVRDDDRVFVEQLKLILLHHERVRQAVYDHNRAFLQRSRWQREQLLAIGDLNKYDRSLIEEWRRVFSPLEEPSEETTDDDKRRSARESYGRLQERTLPAIRPEVRSGYVSFGSMHILADRLEIGWHPDWVELLKDRLAEAEKPAVA